ncbi:MAG: hypothetical protein ABW346_05635 [Terrimicrobium sp.]
MNASHSPLVIFISLCDSYMDRPVYFLGDRVCAIIDGEPDRVVSAKSVKLFPDMLACRAAFVAPPRAEGEMPPVRIDLPNGTSVTSDFSDVDRALSSHFRRDVRLAQVAPDDFTIDIYHPNVEGADPSGHRSYARKVLVVLTACCGWDRRNARAEN